MIKYLVVTSACLAASASALCSFKTQGIDGAGCWDLGVACGYDMSVASQSNAFYSYNPNIKPDCSNLAPGQRVCCNAGGLAPPPNSDGSCAVYAVKTGDNCGTIGGYYGLTIDQIDGFNLKDSTSFGGTWGYRGCSNLQPGNICISKGTSGPVPAKSADPEVQCGPTASGNGTNIKCPLNVCCNEWGHCGLTSEFCDIVPDVNPGVKGCQDECDRDFIMSDPPSQFISVGYFESWNIQWPCLNTRISKQKLDQYTHIHYSFADIGMDLKITLDEYAQAQFAEFKAISKKKIISFGGWGISTDADTHPHLPNAALPQNRAQAARNMVNFMTANGLDGIDIDWEYPEKPDSPGMGSAGEAENYLELLKAIRSILPEGKSLSIAAPASFWYLKAFPIEEMAKHLDYIVYMTYDLHGQWDYGNKWAQVGCEGGDCLRSHTNWTETLDSLSMITHAGVPSNKVLLGLAAYGRSFGQTDPNCHGPDCRYSGPISGATPGSCTANPGTLALAEVNRIRQSGRTRYEYSDSESQIMLYDDNQWVAFNTEAQLENRRYKAMKMNLGGTVTWALDSIGDASNAVDPCDVVSMTMEELQLSTCSSDTLISGMRAYILSIISSLQGLPQSTLDRLKLDPKDRIKQLQDLLLSLDAIETTALLGKRDFLDVGDISFIKQVADAGMAYANSVKNNIVVINVDLLTYEQAEALYQRVMLEISNGNLLPAQVLLGFYVATASVIVIHDVYYASDNILYLSFETYAKWKKNCIKWYWHAHQYFQDMFDECVSKKDIEINIIVDNTTIIEPEDVAGPGKTQDTASVLMPDVSSDTCPLMDVFSYSVHEAVTGMQKTLGYRSWSYDKNGNKQCDMPVYYINLHGQSKGVACNAYKYIMRRWFSDGVIRLEYNRDYERLRRNVIIPGVPNERKFGRWQVEMHNTCPVVRGPAPSGYPPIMDRQNYVDQKDEFPMFSMLQGWSYDPITNTQEFDSSILCIPWYENQADGTVHLTNFYNKLDVWERCDPMDPDSPLRTSTIPKSTLQNGISQTFLVIPLIVAPTRIGNTFIRNTGDFNTECYINRPDQRVPGYVSSVNRNVSPETKPRAHTYNGQTTDYVIRNNFSPLF